MTVEKNADFRFIFLFFFFSPLHFSQICSTLAAAAAASAEAPVQENGEANGEVKEPFDPNAPKKCDFIVLSGRKERCEAAMEALKVIFSRWALSNKWFHLSRLEIHHYRLVHDCIVSILLRRWSLSLSRCMCLLSFTATSLDRRVAEFAR